jgi:hypothetical protein
MEMILPPSWQLPDDLERRIGQTTYGRQRAIYEDGHLVLVLHKPPGPDDAGREGVLFWRDPKGEWHSSRSGQGHSLVKRHIQKYVELEAKLSEGYERAVDASTLFDLLAAATPLARASRNMHQALQAGREALGPDPFLIEMRDLASDVERNLELLLEDLRNAIQYRTAREAEEQARSGREVVRATHRLNILVALFLPLTAVASIFSMNFVHGLDRANPVLFWLVFALGIGLGFVLKAWVLAKPRELAKSEAPPQPVAESGGGGAT